MSKGSLRLGAVLLMVLAACVTPDIYVEGMEITQAIQTSTNSVQLVSKRSIAVRVRVGAVGGNSA